ncbi:MAG: hypothetical protein CL792_01900 [Chloroflexi bacterium]|nr:hypothetical protein [Chloroflexota bacterium]
MSRKVNVLIHPSIQNLYKNLSKNDLDVLQITIDIANKHGIILWAVGGMVRDTIQSNQTADLDLIVEKNIFPFVNAVNSVLKGIIKSEKDFGTASIITANTRIDFALPREEFYQRPASLPSVKVGATLQKDLQRRDFNVNAMALCLNNNQDIELHDYFEGISSLKKGNFKTLHPLSFQDDPTRIFRAARLSIFSQLLPNNKTRKEIDEFKNTIQRLSGKRLWNELSLIAERGKSAEVLLLLEQWNVLEKIHPNLKFSEKSYAILKQKIHPLQVENLIVIMLLPLDLDTGYAILKRLNAPKITLELLEDVRNLLQSNSRTDINDIEKLSHTSDASKKIAQWFDKSNQILIQNKIKKLEQTKLFLNAEDLLSLGISPGPDIGKILQVLREEQFFGRIQSKKQSYLFIKEYLSKK